MAVCGNSNILCVYIYSYLSICDREGERKCKVGEHFANAKLPIFSAVEARLFKVLTQVFICHLT